MTENPFKLIKGENLSPHPAEVALDYIDKVLVNNPYCDLPLTIQEASLGNDFILSVKVEDTSTQLPFVKNGIQIAIFNINYLNDHSSFEDSVMEHDRFELRQVKGVIDLYKRSVHDNQFVHEL